MNMNPIERVTTGGWAKTDWSMSGLGGFVRLYPDIIFENLYPRFVNEDDTTYLARAKRRFQEDYGPVIVQKDEPELHAYARVLWEAKKAQRVADEHRDKYYSDANYRAAVQKEHESRMASDPAYRALVESMAVQQGKRVDDLDLSVQTMSSPLSPTPSGLVSIAQGSDPRYRVLSIPPRKSTFEETYGATQGSLSLPTAQETPWYNSALFGFGAATAAVLGVWWWMKREKK